MRPGVPRAPRPLRRPARPRPGEPRPPGRDVRDEPVSRRTGRLRGAGMPRSDVCGYLPVSGPPRSRRPYGRAPWPAPPAIPAQACGAQRSRRCAGCEPPPSAHRPRVSPDEQRPAGGDEYGPVRGDDLHLPLVGDSAGQAGPVRFVVAGTGHHQAHARRALVAQGVQEIDQTRTVVRGVAPGPVRRADHHRDDTVVLVDGASHLRHVRDAREIVLEGPQEKDTIDVLHGHRPDAATGRSSPPLRRCGPTAFA